ncbi:Calcium-activated potassium channel subunit beta-2 [Fasciolopsis buskii]|uniref:Calcium-activated potassium channel subunit beta-2 n=1 Tax=Fasciolopsis buskii TaxID=27845 RepID=A0A8E0S5S4_9TREM|nr:Calcium-activated potassium channel subunit beta-2 [Fasciolopsis buski]
MESNQGSRDSQLSGPIVSLFMTPSKSPVSASNHIGPGSVVSRARRSTFREPLIKVVYLTCFTLITTGFIIECILLHLVILPSQYETGFTATECAYLRTTLVMDSVKCENRCSKDRSAFQCVRVLISYSKSGKNYTASLFDNIATYQHYHFLGCATSSCHRQNSANQAWVQRFTQLVRRHGRFTCYTNEKHEDEALLYKFYGPSTLFNTIFWPLGLLFLSGICLLFVWLYDRCRVWGDDSGVIA